MKRLLVFFVILSATGGCVSKMPLTSHAHMGHALTTWHDTPEQQGLFVVARKEATIALQEAALAERAGTDERLMRRHAANIVNALNPDIEALGPGLGYGAIRALEGAIDHLEFAATSDDASDNMIRSVARIAELGDGLQREFMAIAASAQVQSSAVAPSPAVAADLRRRLQDVVVASQGRGALSLDGLQAEMSAMLARETDPPYEPVSRRYVLGLIKLPDGSWIFRLPRRARAGHAAHGGYRGYGGY